MMGTCGLYPQPSLSVWILSQEAPFSLPEEFKQRRDKGPVFHRHTKRRSNHNSLLCTSYFSSAIFFFLMETAPTASRVKTKKVFQDIGPTWISCSPFAALSSICITFLPPASSTPAPHLFPEGRLRAGRRNWSQRPSSIFGTGRSRAVHVNIFLSFLDLFYL